MKSKKVFQKGFTLIELVVVLAIIAILTMIAALQYFETLNNARIISHNANVRAIITSAELYLLENGEMAEDIDSLVPSYLDEVPDIPDGLTEYLDDEDYSTGYVVSTEGNMIIVRPETINN